MIIVGFDGGGTKTKCVIGNEKGEILGEGSGGIGNYDTSSVEIAKTSAEEKKQDV